jgi:glycosyltransferase involved in cell wall biosynthesis
MISVIIPAFNQGDLIEEAIDSVLRQQGEETEIIVVNDGSTDNTQAVLQPYINRGEIRYVEQVRSGATAARNRGLEMARGSHVLFLDAGDVVPEGTFAWQTKIMGEEPEMVAVYGDSRNMECLSERRHCSQPFMPSGWVHDYFLRGCWIQRAGQVLVRKSALDQIGHFRDTTGSPEWDLYVRLSCIGKFHYLRRTVLYCRPPDRDSSRATINRVNTHFRAIVDRSERNLFRLWTGLRVAGRQFVPRLLEAGSRDRLHRRDGDAARAYALALALRPTLFVQRSFLAAFIGTLLRRPPSSV